jgi:hypothetical protein
LIPFAFLPSSIAQAPVAVLPAVLPDVAKTFPSGSTICTLAVVGTKSPKAGGSNPGGATSSVEQAGNGKSNGGGPGR